jgi:hypothetical protein
VKPTMEIGQRSTETWDRPWALAHHCNHVGTVDAFDDHAEAVVAHVLNRGHRETLRTDVPHDLSLLCHRTSLAGAPKHKSGAVLEDVGVSTGGQQGSGFNHPSQGSC